MYLGSVPEGKRKDMPPFHTGLLQLLGLLAHHRDLSLQLHHAHMVFQVYWEREAAATWE